ncbi:M23 family metallopeptidase [bacterium]|nr:M23 family metallopeptidase [bacterium]
MGKKTGMVENRHKRLTVLLIPDDDTEPFSINMSFLALKIIGVICIVLLIHIVTGGIFYWRYSVLHNQNSQLVHENIQLTETQDKVYQILPELADLQKKQERMMNALGVKKRSVLYNQTASPETEIETVEGETETAGENKESVFFKGPQTENLDFLKEKNTQYHDFIRNMPTRLPVAGYMSQDYRPVSWLTAATDNSHLGIDIVADIGTPFHSAGDGFVVFSNWTNHLGYLVIIYHGSGFFTYYGHNERNLAVERTFVRKGEVIGFVGSSGISSGSHLHFEVWRNGQSLDPKDVLLSFQ